MWVKQVVKEMSSFRSKQKANDSLLKAVPF